jgi:Tfp pilus assembly protein PilV
MARKLFRPGEQGYALLIAMVFIGIGVLALVSVVGWTVGTAKQTERNNLYSMSSAAAEGATELVMAQMASDFYNQALQGSNGYMSASLLPDTTGWPARFSFSNPYNHSAASYVIVNPGDWTTNWSVLSSANYAGLHAFVANCTASSTATVTNRLYNVSASVGLQFQLVAIPIFQYAIFYNMDLEIDPGAAMTVTGPVFSDAGIWAGSPILTFNGPVSAVGVIATNAADPFSTGYTGGGSPTFSSTCTSNASAVAMPIGTTNDPNAIRALLNIPPSGTDPSSATGHAYFINQADLIISNSAGGIINAFFQDPGNATRLTPVPYDLMQITTNGSGPTTTYTTNNSYSFATNASFYDYRESKTVKAVQLNIKALNSWLTNSYGSNYNVRLNNDTGHYIDSAYVYNNAAASGTTLPAVRVANGSILPNQGLTVITPDPLYVLGNYNANGSSLNNGTNTANTAPAAFMADSISILSTNWNDQLYNSGYALTSRNPASTTVNAAAYEGIVPTVGTNYSGGVENFLRLLENWGTSSPLTYNGSIVVMFPSQYATNQWRPTGNYYNAPKRIWAFDMNFETQRGLPPLTPELRTLYRQSWASQ